MLWAPGSPSPKRAAQQQDPGHAWHKAGAFKGRYLNMRTEDGEGFLRMFWPHDLLTTQTVHPPAQR